MKKNKNLPIEAIICELAKGGVPVLAGANAEGVKIINHQS